jgi:hypothetical protein
MSSFPILRFYPSQIDQPKNILYKLKEDEPEADTKIS